LLSAHEMLEREPASAKSGLARCHQHRLNAYNGAGAKP